LTEQTLSSWNLLKVWLALSVQSFGGGTATLALIRRAAVDEQKWLSDAEFGRFWGLVQLAPGINLLALTILIGRRVAGTRGIALSLVGLLLPSVSLTVLLTAGYVRVQHSLWVQAALRGIVPAVVGLGLVTAGQIALPLLQSSRRKGAGAMVLSLLVLLGAAAAAWLGHLPVLVILLSGGLLCAAGNGRRTP
jgi:chromate transporter